MKIHSTHSYILYKALFALFLSVLMIGPAYAIELFCQSPYPYTCPNPHESLKARMDKIAKVENQLKTKAFKLMLKEIDDELILIQLDTYEDLESLRPIKERNRLQKLFYVYLREVLVSYIKKSGMTHSLGVELVREALHLSIEEALFLEPKIKDRFHEILDQSRLVAFHDNLADLNLSDINRIYRECGKNTFLDDAVALSTKDGKVIIICPGSVIAAIEFKENELFPGQNKAIPLSMTIAHEFAHHFDYRYYPKVYESLMNELSRGTKYKLKGPVKKYMSEISADLWGNKATEILIRKLGGDPHSSEMIAGSLNDLCDAKDDGDHPSGAFRIHDLAQRVYCPLETSALFE